MKINNRISDLVQMYMHVTGESYQEALDNILCTSVGKAINDNTSRYLYEQQTSNLNEIAEELPPEQRKQFTPLRISKSLEALAQNDNTPSNIKLQFQANPNMKSVLIKKIKSYNSKQLQKDSKNHLKIERSLGYANYTSKKENQ